MCLTDRKEHAVKFLELTLKFPAPVDSTLVENNQKDHEWLS